MEGGKRVGPQRKRLGCSDLRRQRITRRTYVPQRALDDPAELLLRELLARRIDGREVRGVDRLPEVVGLDGEAEPVPPTAQAQRACRAQALSRATAG